MPHPNTKLLQAAYEAFSHGDLGPLLAALTGDISWRDSTLGPLTGDYTRKDQVLGLFGKMAEVYRGTLRLEAIDIFANDDRGVVLTREAGTADGADLTWTGVHLRGFRDGRCAQFTAYADAGYQRFWSAKNPGPAPRAQS